jgi:hypothetical protein
MLYIAGQLTQIRETNDAPSHEAEPPVSTLHINSIEFVALHKCSRLLHFSAAFASLHLSKAI